MCNRNGYVIPGFYNTLPFPQLAHVIVAQFLLGFVDAPEAAPFYSSIEHPLIVFPFYQQEFNSNPRPGALVNAHDETDTGVSLT